MPMGGVGTWLYNDTTTETEVYNALKLGARLIDTAYIYGNQVGVANAIKKANVSRTAIFISTKVPGGLPYNETLKHHESNLYNLSTTYVDLLLTHFPCAMTLPN